MNTKFDQLTKNLARSVTRRAALKKFTSFVFIGLGLGRLGLLIHALITITSTMHAQAQGGIPLWTNLYSTSAINTYAIAMAVDSNGNVFVAGIAPTDYVIIKYSNGGVPLWTNRYDGPGGNANWLTATVVDRDGNVIVTGYTSTSEAVGWHYGTIKYSGAGVPLWTNLYSGPFNNDYAYALAVDGSGNVIVTGAVDKGDSSSDFATIKYSSGGVPLWTNLYNGPANDDDYPAAAAVDGSGNVFVTGPSIGSSNSFDYVTIKYSGTGVPLWTRRYNGAANGNDLPYAVAVDSDGNVFVTGGSARAADFDAYDCATIAYSNSGQPLWTNRVAGGGGRAVAVDSGGNVLVTGGMTIKYSSTGVPLWTNDFGFVPTRSLGVDGNVNVIITGADVYNYDIHRIRTFACSSAGVPLWTNTYVAPPPYTHNAFSSALAVDDKGCVFVTGTAQAINGESYFVTIKYSALPALSSSPLDIQRLGNTVVLSWTNAAFGLQSAPLITGSFTNMSGATSPFTNPISGPQKYFRLKSN